jgi:hypothetical protein
VSTEESTDGHIVGHIIIDSAPGLALADTRTRCSSGIAGVSSSPSQAGEARPVPRLAYTDLTQTEPRLSGSVAMANRKGLHFVHRHLRKLYSF